MRDLQILLSTPTTCLIRKEIYHERYMESFGAAVIALLIGIFPASAVPATQPIAQMAQAANSYVPDCTQKNQAQAGSANIKEQCLPGCTYTVRIVDGSPNVTAVRYYLPTATKFCRVRYCSGDSDVSCTTAESVDASKPKGMIISAPDASDETAVSAPTVRIAGITSPAYSNPSPQADPGYGLEFGSQRIDFNTGYVYPKDPFKDVNPIDPSQVSSNPFAGTPQSQSPTVNLNTFADIANQSSGVGGDYQATNPGAFSDSCSSPGCEVTPSVSLPSSFTEISAPSTFPSQEGASAAKISSYAQNPIYAQPSTFGGALPLQVQGEQLSPGSPSGWSNFTTTVSGAWNTFLSWF